MLLRVGLHGIAEIKVGVLCFQGHDAYIGSPAAYSPKVDHPVRCRQKQNSLGIKRCAITQHIDEFFDLASPCFWIFGILYPKQGGVAITAAQRCKKHLGFRGASMAACRTSGTIESLADA